MRNAWTNLQVVPLPLIFPGTHCSWEASRGQMRSPGPQGRGWRETLGYTNLASKTDFQMNKTEIRHSGCVCYLILRATALALDTAPQQSKGCPCGTGHAKALLSSGDEEQIMHLCRAMLLYKSLYLWTFGRQSWSLGPLLIFFIVGTEACVGNPD